MTEAQSEPIDRPFPGAHSQVPGTRGEPEARALDSLPLEATQSRSGERWTVRLPVRAEQVRVSKQVVVCERVLVHRRAVEDVAHVEDQVRREVLRVESEGEGEVQPIDETRRRAGRRKRR